MPGKGPLNWTTTIPVHQTMGECQSMLARAGASSVSVHFEDGDPAGLSFSLKTPHGVRNFTLPVNVDGIQRVLAQANKDGRLRSDGHRNARLEGREHAARVAWRVVKDWLEANLALIDAQMATIDEVMLPWLHIQIGGEEKTLFEHYKAQERAALLPGSDRA
jgi:hypothetical protein